MSRHSLFRVSFVLAGLALAGSAMAQDASVCPQLPDGSGLTWDYRGSGDTQLCRALRADGSEAFGLVITAKPTFEPVRSDRAERTSVDGHDVYWYRAELAQKPGMQARETVLELPNGRSVHLWLQAESDAKLQAGFQMLQDLRFGAAGPQVAGQ
ncbi:MAG TPA: hypothetical protein VHL61_08985 [Luteimonas sp.]|jgi:hypothetical protein|nr:hypothetical protein [Luteimonas sp.]